MVCLVLTAAETHSLRLHDDMQQYFAIAAETWHSSELRETSISLLARGALAWIRGTRLRLRQYHWRWQNLAHALEGNNHLGDGETKGYTSTRCWLSCSSRALRQPKVASERRQFEDFRGDGAPSSREGIGV